MFHLPSDFTPRPLPSNPFLHADLYAAFNLCLSLESRAHFVPLPDPRHPPVVLCARVLGYTLLEVPSISGNEHMAKSINEVNTDDALLALGNYYIQSLLHIFSTKGPGTPVPSDDPSSPDVDNLAEFRRYILEQSSMNPSAAKKAASALLRDGFHCMLKTNMYDVEYLDRKLSAVLARNPNYDAEPLKCAHIFPEALNSNLGENDEFRSDKHEWVSPVWAVVRMIGIQMEELNGAGIHRLENSLTLCSGFFEYFNRLALWLQAVKDQPHTYVVVSTSPATLRRLPSRVVTFTTPDPEVLPLPSPVYLAIHAACCRIARMSGAADYVDKVLREKEELRARTASMGILAEDGSSMDLFGQYITAVLRVP
ncbi:hypothetical protein EV421DRAFT_1969948 [Armillaria borealis]|uniref:HNH nuclease domain-containing protein n=1 Tax=Armillaria borealis TaxID=47425 RepID=A0AA39J9N9_9AGAR|nr:hypothetical protein EV421DRAFT_1969948 [Armillaria borealis]